ncbi:M16 family metallopeptidase [Luteolibacter soli]|uniref:Insulinase family protein n=1 Tax=Luteolibacter soli TaxID=3135280 RepID=A0ABU9AZA6_9BACT
MILFRSRRSRWLAAVAVVAGVALVMGTCRHEDGGVEAAPAQASRLTKVRKAGTEDIAGWSKRFAIQRPPPDELRADPAQQSGAFENGIRYLVMEHPAGPGEVSLRLLVLAGSMHEGPGEDGYAHFIEHLAFQETGQGKAMEVFERLGLATGADTNAHTGLDHTLYQLDLPAADDAALDIACSFLSRTAGGITFSDATVDDERRVVLRELEEKPGSTKFFRKAAALLPGVPALKRSPGGTKESIESASRAALWNFWNRNYVPSRMVVVAVGDLKAGPMIERLRRHFAEIPARPAPAEPALGDPMAASSAPVAFVDDETTKQVTLTLASPRPIDREPDSLGKRRDELVRWVALEMLEHRLKREFQGRDIAGSPPEGAGVEVMPGMRWFQVSATASRQDTRRILRPLILGLRGAVASGFHPTEFAEARGEIRHELRQALLSRLIDSTADLATRLADGARTGRLVELPEDELNRSQADLATITREECEAVLKAEWPMPLRILFSGPADLSKDEWLSSTATRAMSDPASGMIQGTEATRWAPEPIGPPGKIIRRQLEESRGYLEAELSNHVLVRLAPIPSLGGFVQVQVDVGYGRQSLPPGKAALATAARSLCRWYPLEGWDDLKLTAALADEDVSRFFGAQSDSLQWEGETDRSQLRRQLDLLAALVQRPGLATHSPVWKPSAHTKAWEENVRSFFSASTRERWRQHTGRDPRFELYPDGLMESDSSQVADWLLPQLAGERVCVSLAGDFEPEAALTAVAASFGALPERPPWDAPSPFPPPPVTGPGVTRLPLDAPEAAALVTLSFPLGPAGDAEEMLRRRLLEELLQLRVRQVMREERGESYAPMVMRSWPVKDGIEWLEVRVACQEGHAEETSATLREMIANFRMKGWTWDEFQRALRPLPRTIARRNRSPSAVLANLQAPVRMPVPEQLDPAALAGMESSVRELAQRVLDVEAVVELRVDE